MDKNFVIFRAKSLKKGAKMVNKNSRISQGGGRLNSLKIAVSIGFLSLLVLAILVVSLIVLLPQNEQNFIHKNEASALTLSPSTTYYVSNNSYYTFSSSTKHYRCTNSQHSGSNDYTSSSPSGTCYTTQESCSTCGGDGFIAGNSNCSNCNGTGYITRPCSTCSGKGTIGNIFGTTVCSDCEGTGEVRVVCGTVIISGKPCSATVCSDCTKGIADIPHSHSAAYYYTMYYYKNIDTGGTVSTQSSFTKATGYTVTFNANSGTGSDYTQYFLHGHAQNLKTNSFTRENYNFLGWNTTSTASTAIYADGQMVTTLTTGSTITLYAIWEKQATPLRVTVSCTTGTYTITKQMTNDYDDEIVYILPQDGMFIYSAYVTNDALDAQQLTAYEDRIYKTKNCFAINYIQSSETNMVRFEFINITGAITLNITLADTRPELTIASGGTKINGVAIIAQEGGEARVIGSENPADTDLIHLSAVPFTGYMFAGWVADGVDLGEYLMSANIQYSLIKNKIVTATFIKITDNINTETNNTNDFWE